jgi:peptide/nickel transport system permease protein
MTATPPVTQPAVEALDESPARHGLLRYAVTKAGGALFSIAMVIVATFFLFRLLPGDPVRALAQGRNMTPEQLDLERARLGLDKSLPEQFLQFVKQTVHICLPRAHDQHHWRRKLGFIDEVASDPDAQGVKWRLGVTHSASYPSRRA